MDNDKYQILKQIFGYDTFRLDQEDVINTILNGHNALAVMPTGAGKSLCFQIPALVKDGIAIVVSPLVALMQDQVAALKLAGVAADAINSSQDRDTNVAIWQKAMRGGIKILYMSPERLMDDRMIAALPKLNVNLFAIDEAHCISQWGAAFRPEYADLRQLHTKFPNVPIAAMTATADEATRKDIKEQLFGGRCKIFVAGFDRPNITLNVAAKESGKEGWKKQLLEYVEQRKGQSGIVYCISRDKTEEVEQMLNKAGFEAVAYHARLSKDERMKRQNRFLSEEGVIVAATIAFGMGIDKSDVRYVFHADLPGTIEAYYQEIGRAGRDGKQADAMMVFSGRDIQIRRMFIDNEKADEEHKRRQFSRLNALINYAEAQSCRRKALLAYFGETIEKCDNCDTCINPPELQDGTEQAQIILQAIVETGAMFGQAHIIDVVCGANNQKILNARHEQLDSHAKGKEFGAKQYWQAVVRQMIVAGLLRVDVAGYSGLKITEEGQEFRENQHDQNNKFSFAPPIAASMGQKKSTDTTQC